MITKLTEKQTAAMPAYVDKYLKLGLATYQASSANEFTTIIEKVYAAGGFPPPPKGIFLVDSPMAVVNFMMDNYGVEVSPYQMVYGSQEASWLSFYNFFKNEVGITGLEKIEGLTDLLGKCSFLACFDEVCVISKNPIAIHMVNGRLHNETGMTVEYADGFGTYSLRGIAVPDWVITTPKDQIDKTKVLALSNSEQRMAVMRYIGIAEFLSHFKPEVLDKDDEYQLLLLTIEGVKTGPYLSMKCPSTGRPYLEGVGEPLDDKGRTRNIDPNIKTISDALTFRFRKASGGLFKGSIINHKNLAIKA